MNEATIWEKYKKLLSKYYDIVNIEPRYKGKLKGALVVSCISDLINQYFEENNIGYTLSSNNVFVESFSTEFDLLIIKKGAKTLEEGVPIYAISDVKAIIEVKATGLFFSPKKLENPLKKELIDFESIQKENCDCQVRFGYFTMQEQISKGTNSIDFINITKQFINEFDNGALLSPSVYCVANTKLGKGFSLYNNSISFEEWIEYLVS